MINRKSILSWLCAGRIGLPPLGLRVLSTSPSRSGADALVEVAWEGRRFRFAAACGTEGSPRAIRDLAARAVTAAGALRAGPLLVVPWLPEERLRELERQRISGIDLNGNGVVVVPGKLLIFRTGQPNAYPQSRPIRNVYRGDSSIVARVFLLRPTYQRVGEVREEILARSGDVALSTTSKVIQALEADLVVGRESGAIRLLQPDKLLDKLAASYRPPRVWERWIGRCSLPEAEMSRALAAAATAEGPARGPRVALTGACSVNRYATAAREPVVSVYCDGDPRRLVEGLGVASDEGARFPNLEVLATDDATAYFDRRTEEAGPFASPVQAWLELVTGDKRQREAAEQVRERILNDLTVPAGGRP